MIFENAKKEVEKRNEINMQSKLDLNELLIKKFKLVLIDSKINTNKKNNDKRIKFIADMINDNFILVPGNKEDEKLFNQSFYKTLTVSNIKLLEKSLNVASGNNINDAKILFDNFPDNNVSDFEFKVLNAIYYITGLTPTDLGLVDKIKRVQPEKTLFDLTKLIKLRVDTNNVHNDTLIKLVEGYFEQQTLMDVDDVKIVNLLFRLNIIDKNDILTILNDIINGKLKLSDNRENITSLLGTIIKNYSYDKEIKNTIKKVFSKISLTATDVLRMTLVLNDLNLNSIDKSKYVLFKFSRPQKDLLLFALNTINATNVTLDMFKYEKLFKQLSKTLHPMAQNKYKNVKESFNNLFNNNKPNNWANKVQTLYNILNEDKKSPFFEQKFEELINLYTQRPTDFSRNILSLFNLLNGYSNKEEMSDLLFDCFVEEINNISLSALLSLDNALKKDYNENRVVRIKGTYKAIENSNNYVSEKYLNQLILLVVNNIVKRITTDNKLTDELTKKSNEIMNNDKDAKLKIYIDDSYQGIPLEIRNSQVGADINYLPSLSRIKIPDNTDFIRTFVYWKNGVKNDEDDRIDLDSSISIYDRNNNLKSYGWNTNSQDSLIKFSGDITDAEPDAVEFHDINLKELKRRNVKYLAYNVASYTNQKFNDMLTANAGFMFNTDSGKDNRLFRPENAKHNFNLVGNGRFVMPFIIDVYNNEIIWVNAQVEGNNFSSANNNKDIIDRLLRKRGLSLDLLLTATVYNDMGLTAIEFVNNAKDADIAFTDLSDTSNLNSDINYKTIVEKLLTKNK